MLRRRHRELRQGENEARIKERKMASEPVR